MAFNNEKSETIVEIPKNNRGDYIVISKILDISDESLKAVDIRQYWTTADGNLSPTKKGLRITPDQLSTVIDSLSNIN